VVHRRINRNRINRRRGGARLWIPAAHRPHRRPWHTRVYAGAGAAELCTTPLAAAVLLRRGDGRRHPHAMHAAPPAPSAAELSDGAHGRRHARAEPPTCALPALPVALQPDVAGAQQRPQRMYACAQNAIHLTVQCPSPGAVTPTRTGVYAPERHVFDSKHECLRRICPIAECFR
jgi:hypothetical protein